MGGFEDRETAERRFDEIFEQLGFVEAYARRRGASDPEGTAAEVMTIAWRRLPDLPEGDPRPWLIATARNLVFAAYRKDERERHVLGRLDAPGAVDPPAPVLDLDPTLEAALRALSADDREALLLTAWEALSPKEAAQSLGISPVAFRVRLHRARRRVRAVLRDPDAAGRTRLAIPRSANG
jgi:RNA polymerase sigma factor (sigma-70 family)